MELKRLYGDLQFQRDVLVDDVRRRIEEECARSTGLVARLWRDVRREEGSRVKGGKEKRERKGDDDARGEISEDDNENEEMEGVFDTAMHNGVPLSNTIPVTSTRHNHDTTTLLSAMYVARQDLSSEIVDLELQLENLQRDCGEKVSGLSDLRYGRFSGARGSENTTNGSGMSGGSGSGVTDNIIEALEELRSRLESG